jgi:hypothetical protein
MAEGWVVAGNGLGELLAGLTKTRSPGFNQLKSVAVSAAVMIPFSHSVSEIL